MKTSIFPLNTLKEYPNDAEIISHQLMIKAGLVKRVTSGIYLWTPLGLRVLRKTETIIREEMDRAGALELLMPSVQPAELWKESGRWGAFGAELLRFKDRHQKDYCLGPTHEEVITDFVRREIKSYKQLPLNFYQIQWKFRDEIRPRFGVMRSREFLMKDAYSFHIDGASLEATYQRMYSAYSAIFDRVNLQYRAVLADSGAIGGDRSQEFHVLAEAGEDAIAISTESSYAANIERAETIAVGMRSAPTQSLEKVATPDARTVEDVAQLLNIPHKKILKTLIVHGENNTLIALCLRGDHTLNETKASKIEGVLDPLTFASDEEIITAINAMPGSIGPINLPIKVLFDHQVLVESDFACGANEEGFHFTGVNFVRDLAEGPSYDLRNIEEGDSSPCGKGVIALIRGIEVGHIFQLGDKYSHALNATVLDENGKQRAMQMGCYGIGVTRIVAAAIEQCHDAQGIIWPISIAPFCISIIPMNYHKSESVKKAADDLYHTLIKLKIDVLLEDRNIRAGNAFSDHELIGIPHRIVIGEKSLSEGKVEYKGRTDDDAYPIDLKEIIAFVQKKIQEGLTHKTQ